MKKVFKKLFFLTSYLLARFFWFFGADFNRPVILLYHSIGDNKSKYTVSEKDFVKQMQFLSKKKKVVSLEFLVNAIKRGEKTKNFVAITLDDGYFDTTDFVSKKMKEFGFPPATVFLTTNLEESEKLGGIKRPNEEGIKKSFIESGLVFEIHGHNHKPFREALEMGKDVLEKEIKDCKDKILSITGRSPVFVAYPSGRESESVRSFVESLGFLAGFGNHYGTISNNENMMTLPRVQVDRDTDFFLFKVRMTRAVDLAEDIKKLFKKYGKRK